MQEMAILLRSLVHVKHDRALVAEKTLKLGSAVPPDLLLHPLPLGMPPSFSRAGCCSRYRSPRCCVARCGEGRIVRAMTEWLSLSWLSPYLACLAPVVALLAAWWSSPPPATGPPAPVTLAALAAEAGTENKPLVILAGSFS